MQARIIHLFLALCKFAIYRYCPGKVGSIATIQSTKIHQYQFSIFTFLIIEYIMQGSGTVAAGDDAAVCFTAGAVAQKFVQNFRFYFIFHYPWFNELQQPA